jgi:hypothetical protein
MVNIIGWWTLTWTVIKQSTDGLNLKLLSITTGNIMYMAHLVIMAVSLIKVITTGLDVG